MLNKLFLPVGMPLALLMAFTAPSAGGFIKNSIGNNALIVFIFLLCGWEARLADFHFDKRTALAFLFGAALALILSPWLALWLLRMLRLSGMATTGLVVISAVPPTISSGVVMTRNAAGNAILAMTVTLGYNILGVISMPLMLAWCLAGNGSFDIQPLAMFLNLLLLIILPFVAGLLVRRIARHELPKCLNQLPSLCIVLLLLSFFSGSGQMLRSSPLSLILLSGLAGLVLHSLLLSLIWFGGAALGFSVADRKALLFTAGSKTISITLATLAIMKTLDGQAAVPCMVFYFVQMMMDSCLAGKLGANAQPDLKKA